MGQATETPRIIPAEKEPLVETTVRKRRLEMYPLLRQEISLLTRGYSSPCLGLFGAFGGAFVTLVTTDLTASLEQPIKRYFVDSTVGTGCATFVFFLLAAREWWQSRQIVTDLKKEIVEVEVVQKPLPRAE